MKKSLRLIVVFLIGIGMAGCDFLDTLLTTNIFDTDLKLTASEVSGMSVAELAELAQSPDFFDLIESDPAVGQAVIDQVMDVLADPASPQGEYQDAAILGAAVVINTSAAGDLINNITNNIDIISDPPMNGSDPDIAAIIEQLVPPSVYANGVIQEAAFIEMIDALYAADFFYDALGLSLGSGVYDASYSNPGEIAQNAFVASLVGAIVMPEPYASDPQETMGSYLYDLLVVGGTPEPAGFAFPVLDPSDPGYDPVVDGPLYNIFMAAGIDPAAFGM